MALVFDSSSLRIAATTDVYVFPLAGAFRAVCGIALLGRPNMGDNERLNCGNHPCDPDFFDTLCVGRGGTVEGAIEDLKVDIQQVSEAVWEEWREL